MPYLILRDGKPVRSRLDTEADVMAEMHRRVSYSIDHATTHEGYSIVEVDEQTWHPAEAEALRREARQKYYSHGGTDVIHGFTVAQVRHLDEDQLSDDDRTILVNCGACVLQGKTIHLADDEDPKDHPNYAGWARVLVQNRIVIPDEWAEAFGRELDDTEYPSYVAALRRDVRSFGVLGQQARRQAEQRGLPTTV